MTKRTNNTMTKRRTDNAMTERKWQSKQWSTIHYTENWRSSNIKPHLKLGMNSCAPEG
jgi:hypothetical protein